MVVSLMRVMMRKIHILNYTGKILQMKCGEATGTVGSGPELITSSREWCDNSVTTSTSLQNLPDKSCDLEVTPH